VHLRLSRLTRAYRHLEDLRAAEGPLRSLLEQHEGELFCLRSGDLVCCAKAPRADFDAAVLRVFYMMREDQNLHAAIERGEEDAFLCRWYELERDYDSLLAFAKGAATDPARPPQPPQPQPPTASADTAARPAGRTPANCLAASTKEPPKHRAPVPPGSAVALPKAALRRPIDADRFAMLERSLENVDVSRFLKMEPVAFLDERGDFHTVLQRHGIDYEALGRVVTPGFDLTADHWFHRRLATVMAKRLLRSDLSIPTGKTGDRLIELTTESVFTEAFGRALRRRGKAFLTRMIATFAAADVFADPKGYLDVLQRLREHGLRSAVTALDPLQFAMRADSLLPAEYEGLSWPAFKSLGGGDAAKLEAFIRAFKRRDPERVILESCHEPQAIDFGLHVGIRLFCGEQVSCLR